MRLLALMSVLVALMAAPPGCSPSNESAVADAAADGAWTDHSRPDRSQAAEDARADTCYEERTIEQFQSSQQTAQDSAYYAVPQEQMEAIEDGGPRAVLRTLRREGVAIRHVYFRASAPSCSAPGSNKGMSVAVPAQMIVEVQPEASTTAGLGLLERVDGPPFSPCPYNVTELTPAACP